MQISTRTKQNKNQSQTHLKASSESTQVTQEKSNVYLQQFIKQNKSIRNLNENFKEIPNPLISNIQSIFSSEERKKLEEVCKNHLLLIKLMMIDIII